MQVCSGKRKYTTFSFVCISDNLVTIISHEVEFVLRYMENILGGEQKHA